MCVCVCVRIVLNTLCFDTSPLVLVLHESSQPQWLRRNKNPGELKAWMNWSNLTRVRQPHILHPTAESGRKFEAPDMCVFCTSEDLWMSAFHARKSFNSCCGNALGTFARLKTSRQSKLCPSLNWQRIGKWQGCSMWPPCFTLFHLGSPCWGERCIPQHYRILVPRDNFLWNSHQVGMTCLNSCLSPW